MKIIRMRDGQAFQIITEAIDREGQILVIYQQLTEPFSVFVQSHIGGQPGLKESRNRRTGKLSQPWQAALLFLLLSKLITFFFSAFSD